MTKFKVGDTVRIRNLTNEERYGQNLHYHIDMRQCQLPLTEVSGLQTLI